MSEFLNKMRKCTQQRLAVIHDSLGTVSTRLSQSRVPHPFLFRFQKAIAPRLIAEVKFASPSFGKIATGDAVKVAKQYLTQGAAAISVLTEPDYFQGSITYLQTIRDAFPDALLLMKDFILDEVQLLQAQLYGADAVLLIVAFLEIHTLEALYQRALALGLTPLVEVHTPEELQIAQALGAQLIGVNNRNLRTLSVDLSVSKTLSQAFDGRALFISESGIQSAEDMLQLNTYGFDGFLIGSHLMRQDNPGQALAQLQAAYHDNAN